MHGLSFFVMLLFTLLLLWGAHNSSNLAIGGVCFYFMWGAFDLAWRVVGFVIYFGGVSGSCGSMDNQFGAAMIVFESFNLLIMCCSVRNQD